MENNSDSDNENPTLDLESNLSLSALAALNEYLTEKKVQEAEELNNEKTFIKEDFKYNQFWYDEATSIVLAEELLNACPPGGRVGLLSAPKAMPALQKLAPKGIETYVFDIDGRFEELYAQYFVHYNLYAPEKIPVKLHHTFDAILFDPPFHNHDTMALYRQAAVLLMKPEALTKGILACTGQILRGSLLELFGIRATDVPISFESKFCNPSYVYSNGPSMVHGSYIDEDL